MAVRDTGAPAAGVLLPGIVAASALAVWFASFNAFEPPKFFVLLAAGAALAAVLAARAVMTGRLTLPSRPAQAALALFVVGLVLATVTSPDPLWSLIGVRTRYGGLLTYLTMVAVLLAAVRFGTTDLARRFLHAVAVTVAVVSGIGLLQLVGLDLIGRGSDLGVTSTFGNNNFASGWTGAAFGALAWMGLSSRGWDGRRWLAVVIALAAAGFLIGAGALQGLPAAVAAVAVVAIAALRDADARARRLVLVVGAAVLVLGAGVGVAGVLGAGPAAGIAEQRGVELRGYYWGAALAMAADEPLTGVGLDGYGPAYRLHRSYDAATTVDFNTSSDAAHNVTLHFLAGGGIILAAGWLAIVAVTGVALVRGLRSAERPRRLLLGGVGGVWLGYQVQALVSIDIPALMALHWVSAGLVLALAAPKVTVRLPWALPDPAPAGSRQVKGGKRRRTKAVRPPAWRVRAGWGLAGVITVVGLVVAVLPLWAEVAVQDNVEADTDLRQDDAVAAAVRGARRGFWDPTYAQRAGAALLDADNPEESLVWFERIDARGRGALDSALSAARAASRLERVEGATAWYERSLELEPHHPEVAIEAATYLSENGAADRAVALVERVLADDPDNTAAAELQAELEG